jgi:hypothetical protein
MTLLDALNEPQDESVQQNGQLGLDGQDDGSAVKTQPGADDRPPKHYTQEEWDTREQAYLATRTKADRAVSQARKAMAEQALLQQIDNAEREHEEEDRRAVDYGEITQEQAKQRQGQRQEQVRQGMQSHHAMLQSQAQFQQLETEAGMLAREVTAARLAKEFGVDENALLSDKTLTTGERMLSKAERLSLDRDRAELKGSETFDSGQSGTSRRSINSMSPEEKIGWALAHPPKRQAR